MASEVRVRWLFSQREQERNYGHTNKRVTVPENGRARSLNFRATGKGETSQWLRVSEEAAEFLREEFGEERVEVQEP